MKIQHIKKNSLIKLLNKAELTEDKVLSEIFKVDDCNKFSLFFKGGENDTLTIQIQYGIYNEEKDEYYFSELEDLSPTKIDSYSCSGDWEYVIYEVIPCQLIRFGFSGNSDAMTIFGFFSVPNSKDYRDLVY